MSADPGARRAEDRPTSAQGERPSSPAWRTVASFDAAPPAAGWRDQLAQRLGQRPRRLGGWAELALHGALECLAAAGERQLPEGALLRLASATGPREATRTIAAQAGDGLPMPFAFMQSQPSHALAALSQHLGWCGDARFVHGPDLPSLLRLAQWEAARGGPAVAAAGLLFGWVDEEPACTRWWRLRPTYL
ncbi:MAG: hypothetical protein U1F53_19150 [Burkholderiaceae bacterium]